MYVTAVFAFGKLGFFMAPNCTHPEIENFSLKKWRVNQALSLFIPVQKN
jgi:hypothetical protein